MAIAAKDIARELADRAEAVCRQYLSNGRRQGVYWMVGNIRNEPGRSVPRELRGRRVRCRRRLQVPRSNKPGNVDHER